MSSEIDTAYSTTPTPKTPKAKAPKKGQGDGGSGTNGTPSKVTKSSSSPRKRGRRPMAMSKVKAEGEQEEEQMKFRKSVPLLRLLKCKMVQVRTRSSQTIGLPAGSCRRMERRLKETTSIKSASRTTGKTLSSSRERLRRSSKHERYLKSLWMENGDRQSHKMVRTCGFPLQEFGEWESALPIE